MYGWRGLLGYVNPAVLASPGREFHDMLPDGVGILVATMLVDKLEQAELERELQGQVRCAQALAQAGAGFIITGGGPAVAAGGPGADAAMAKRLSDAAGVPCTTNLTAGVDALRALGAHRIAVASPFKPEVNETYHSFLTAAGFEVGAIDGIPCGSNREISQLDDFASYRAGRKAAAAAMASGGPIEALYIPCGRWPAAKMIEALETDLGVPVVSSIQACIWVGLRGLCVGERVEGYGRLLRM